MTDLRGRRLDSFRAYDNGNDCLEGMKECRKQIRLRGLLNRADCVRVGQQPTPNPYPNPYPNPNPYPTPNPYPNPYPNPVPNPIPNPGYGLEVTALIEDRLVSMRGYDASELYINCLSAIRVSYGSVDEILVTINNNRYAARSTSGWYSDTDVCSLIEQQARATQRNNYGVTNRITGTLENRPFQIISNDRGDLLRQCMTTFQALNLGQTDEMNVSVNGAPFRRLTTSGWWQTPAKSCTAMLINIDPSL